MHLQTGLLQLTPHRLVLESGLEITVGLKCSDMSPDRDIAGCTYTASALPVEYRIRVLDQVQGYGSNF